MSGYPEVHPRKCRSSYHWPLALSEILGPGSIWMRAERTMFIRKIVMKYMILLIDTNSDYWADFCPTWDDFWLGWFYGCPEMVDNWGWFIIVGPTLIIFKDKLGCKILPSTGDAKFLLGQPHASLARIPSAANAPGWAGHGDHQPAPKGTYHRKPEIWKTKLWPKKCWLQNSQTFQRRTQIKKLRRILKNPWNILRWNIHIKPDSTFRNTKSFHSMSLSNR